MHCFICICYPVHDDHPHVQGSQHHGDHLTIPLGGTTWSAMSALLPNCRRRHLWSQPCRPSGRKAKVLKHVPDTEGMSRGRRRHRPCLAVLLLWLLWSQLLTRSSPSAPRAVPSPCVVTISEANTRGATIVAAASSAGAAAIDPIVVTGGVPLAAPAAPPPSCGCLQCYQR